MTPQEHCVACISVKINRLWGSLHVPSLSLLECVHSRICSFTQHIFTECFPFARPWVHVSAQSSQQPVLLELASRGEAVRTETNRCIKQGQAGTRAFEGCWRRGLDGVRVPGPESIQSATADPNTRSAAFQDGLGTENLCRSWGCGQMPPLRCRWGWTVGSQPGYSLSERSRLRRQPGGGAGKMGAGSIPSGGWEGRMGPDINWGCFK